MSTTIKIRANAKVNLALRITGQRPDGYHTISSVFQEIDLHDRLIFTPAEKFGFSSTDHNLPTDERNLCVAAYRRIAALNGENYRDWQIHLEKNIPIGAGLGGGSSDAAAVIKFLNQHWQLQLDRATLSGLALELGCDVPFYIHGKTQGVEGIGERLIPLHMPQAFALLLVCPPIHISTRWAYGKFDLTKQKAGYKFTRLYGDEVIHWQLFENQFESVVFQSYPEIGVLKKALRSKGAQYAGLSGSGSTVIGVFKNKQEAEAVKPHFRQYPTYVSLPKLWKRI